MPSRSAPLHSWSYRPWQLTLIQVVCGSLFGVAITAAVARTVIRYRNHTPRALDDVFLLLACAGLTGATVLCFVLIPGAGLFDELFAGRPVKMPADSGAFTTYYNSILDAYVAVTWIVLFAVKFCFLAFFRLLIDRLTRMIIYWRCVVVITAVLSILSLSENFIACPRINADSGELSFVPHGSGTSCGLTCLQSSHMHCRFWV